MNILTVDHITKSYGERKLFDNASFFLQEGEKVGIIGRNGTGKSTLLKMITGLEEPEEGSIVKGNRILVAYLPQNPEFSPKDTLLEGVLKGMITSHTPSADQKQQLEIEAKAMLTRLGVEDLERTCENLSGGERKRLALVSVLLSTAEIIVLDEPTNHLDNDMAEWLEEQLKKRKGAMLLVTHDRYFLNSVTSRIVEIDKGNLYSYEANYAGYLALKAEREEMAEATERKRQSLLRVELEWMQRGARARSTKQKAHIQRVENLQKQTGPMKDKNVELGSVSSRLGRTTVELEGITKGFEDRTLIRDFSYIFLKNDRVGFIGPNGCGKSTLLKIIVGDILPDAGSVLVGQTVKIGYYRQIIGEEEMPANKRVIDYIRDEAEFVDTPEGKVSASKMLERFLFEGEDQYGLLGKLSGGERRRLYLLKVLMGAPNVLILDEPTNDLDIATLTILEDYLDTFQGIVVIVSHDRYFLDRTVSRIFAFAPEGVLQQYEGGYSDYHNSQLLEKEAKEEVVGKKATGEENASPEGKDSWKENRTKKLKFSYQEQKDYETIEADIAHLEETIEKIEADILANANDYTKLTALHTQKQEAEEQLEAKMDRWMYLEDLAERINAQP